MHRKLVLKVKATFLKNAVYFLEVIQYRSYSAFVKNFSNWVGVKCPGTSFHFNSHVLFPIGCDEPTELFLFTKGANHKSVNPVKYSFLLCFQSLEPLPVAGPDFGALGEEAELVEVEPESKQEILENKDVST